MNFCLPSALCYQRPFCQMFSVCVAGGVRNEVVCKESKQRMLSYMGPEHGLYLTPFVLVSG